MPEIPYAKIKKGWQFANPFIIDVLLNYSA